MTFEPQLNIMIMLRRLLGDGVVKAGREGFAYYLTFDTIRVIRGLRAVVISCWDGVEWSRLPSK